MAVAGGTQGGDGGGGGSGSVGASSCSSSSSGSGDGGGGGGSASVPGFQPLLLPLAAPLSSPPTPLPPPARPPLPSTTSVLRGAHFSGGRSGRQHAGGRSRFLPSFRPGREGGSPWRWLGAPLGPVGRLWVLRGEAATSCFPAPPLMLMLLSGKQNRQWDRSPSSACTCLAAGARSPHLRMGGFTRGRDARSRRPVAHTGNKGFVQGSLWVL